MELSTSALSCSASDLASQNDPCQLVMSIFLRSCLRAAESPKGGVRQGISARITAGTVYASVTNTPRSSECKTRQRTANPKGLSAGTAS